MYVDGATLAYRYRDSFGKKDEKGPLTKRALLDWLGEAGIAIDDPKVQKEMGPVMDAVGEATAQATGILLQGAFASYSGGGGYSAHIRKWESAVPVAIACGVWLVGCLYLFRKRWAEWRARRRTAHSEQS